MNATLKSMLLTGLIACAASPLAVAGDDGPDWLNPEWLSRPSESLVDSGAKASDQVLLVAQRARNDGAEMLTLRFPIAELGPVLTYAGAGLNRTVYFAETDLGETFTTGHGRHRSLGAAAELGAEWRVTERLAMSADLRWIDLASDAGLLRSGQSLVAADPVALGLSLGYRFR
jgi:opacity protein-like surface antigen